MTHDVTGMIESFRYLYARHERHRLEQIAGWDCHLLETVPFHGTLRNPGYCLDLPGIIGYESFVLPKGNCG